LVKFSNIITVSQSGNYSVSVTNNDNCQITKHFLVIDSGVATIDSVIINDFSQTNNSVQINVSGNGNYEYSLNGEQYQDSSIFLNVFPDVYTVSIRDKNGCGITTQQITVLDYPK
jgi:hypothetical protein